MRQAWIIFLAALLLGCIGGDDPGPSTTSVPVTSTSSISRPACSLDDFYEFSFGGVMTGCRCPSGYAFDIVDVFRDECRGGGADVPPVDDCNRFQLKCRKIVDICMNQTCNNSYACMQYSDSEQSYPCLRVSAVAGMDVTVCKLIQAKSIREECYSEVAAVLGDPILCERITLPYESDRCFFNTAITVGYNMTCEKIGDPYRKDVCYRAFLPGDDPRPV